MTLGVGVIGCGVIADIYFKNAARFDVIEMRACADIRAEAAEKVGRRYGVPALSPDELLKRDDIDIVLNLTVPAAHAEVSLAALSAGKHVYSEKPLAIELEDGRSLVAEARKRGLRIGCAPDTILGAGVQKARELIEGGAIGKPLIGTAAVMSHGMEHWHPNPGFFFLRGGGPVYDIGPYYIATLVELLGPIREVSAVAQTGFPQRIVTAEGPLKGTAVPVEVATSVQSLLTFASGAQITFLASWDVWAHSLKPIELHGTEASLRVPDPNFFGGVIEIAEGRKDWRAIPTEGELWGRPNWPEDAPRVANYRGLGLADMARGILEDRPHHCSGELALHTLAVFEAILRSAEERQVLTIAETLTRPHRLAVA